MHLSRGVVVAIAVFASGCAANASDGSTPSATSAISNVTCRNCDISSSVNNSMSTTVAPELSASSAMSSSSAFWANTSASSVLSSSSSSWANTSVSSVLSSSSAFWANTSVPSVLSSSSSSSSSSQATVSASSVLSSSSSSWANTSVPSVLSSSSSPSPSQATVSASSVLSSSSSSWANTSATSVLSSSSSSSSSQATVSASSVLSSSSSSSSSQATVSASSALSSSQATATSSTSQKLDPSGFSSSQGTTSKSSQPQATGPPRYKPLLPGSGKPHDPQDPPRGGPYSAPEVAGFNFHNGDFFDPAAPNGRRKLGQSRQINSAIPKQIQKALSDDRIDFYDPGHGVFYYVNKCDGGKGCIVIEVARSCDCYVSAQDQELHILYFDPLDETVPSVYNQDTKLPVAVEWYPAPGDSFEKIAEHFATNLATLIAANPLITDPYMLNIGQPINVPAQTHTVERGETMVTIANMYNVPLKTVEDLNRAIKHPKDIHPGQLLKVPTRDTAEPFAYLTQPGDTFEKIAAQYGQTVPAIIAANPQIADPDVLYSGQVINIPVYMPRQGKLDFDDTCPKQEAEAKKRDATRFARAAPGPISTTTTTIEIGPTNAPIVVKVLV